MKSNVLQIPTWLNADEAKSQMPTTAWHCISQPGSLSEYLRTITQGTIQHRLLFANWGRANSIERQALHLSAEVRTWVRCIEWRHQDKLWVYARAIFPESTIKTTQTLIPGLGVQSLGDVIFKIPHLTRSPFTYCLLTKDSVYYADLASTIDTTPSVWARRSIIYFHNQPILIIEIFTPEAYATPNA